MFRFFSFRTVLLGCCALAAAGVMAACTLADQPIPAGPVQVGPLPGQQSTLAPASLPSAANGAQIFAAHCAACHGFSGKGDGPQSSTVTQQGGHVPDFTDAAFARAASPSAWFETITNGNVAKLMPPWGQTLSDQERWDVTYYLMTFSAPQDVLDAGQTAYASTCESCHAADGSQNGLTDAAKMAALSPQNIHDQYVVSGTDGVHTFGDKLDEATRWAVVAYVRTFSYNPSLQAAALPGTPTPTSGPTSAANAGPTAESTSGTPGATAVPAPVFGSVTGKVTNGSTNGSVPPNLTVTLSGLQLDDQGNINQFVTQSATIGADGSFRFDNLPMDKPNSAYLVKTTYQDVDFQNFDRADPTKPSMDLPVTIYEVTTDPSVIHMDAMHLFIQQHPNALLVVQVMIFSNSSDKAFMGATRLANGLRGSVAFSVPSDATSISFDSGTLGGRFVDSGGAMYDTEQVPPGSQSDTISMTYIVPYQNGRDFSIPIEYPTAQMNVLAAKELQVSGGALTAGSDRTFNGQALGTYTAQNLTPGQTLTFHVGAGLQLLDIVRIALAAILAALIVAGLVFFFVRRRAALAAPSAAPISGAEADALLRQIAALDESFKMGKINRLEYEGRRASLKAQLAAMMGDQE